MITVETSWICDYFTVHPKYFTHQSTKSHKKTPTRELKHECVALTLKQKIKLCKRPEKGENWVSVSFSHGTERVTQPEYPIPHT